MDMILCKCESGTELNGSQVLVKCWMLDVFKQEKHLNIQEICHNKSARTPHQGAYVYITKCGCRGAFCNCSVCVMTLTEEGVTNCGWDLMCSKASLEMKEGVILGHKYRRHFLHMMNMHICYRLMNSCLIYIMHHCWLFPLYQRRLYFRGQKTHRHKCWWQMAKGDEVMKRI